MTGFALTHRSVFDHPLFEGDSSRLGAWLWLCGKACWKQTPFNVNGKTITLDRGQICVSVRQLAEHWGWSKSAVDRFLTRLETETMIEREAGHGRLVITICNYGKYQDFNEGDRDSSGTASGTAAGQQRDIKEQGNKGTREDTSVSSQAPRPPKHLTGKNWPEIPEWVPIEAWNGFIEMRRRKRANPTPRAVELLVGNLAKLRDEGHDLGKALDQSTLKNWTDVYAPKENHHGTDQPASGPRDGFLRVVHNELGIGAGKGAA